MGKHAAILLFLGVFYLKICFVASLNRSSIDEYSLLALKAHMNSDVLSKNWSKETPYCTWIGVGCSRMHPRVTSLYLSDLGIRGTIAKEIGNLSFLTFLDMSNNSINGEIPAEIGNLRRLRVLDMALNQLNDHMPRSLGLLGKLEGLNLSNNYLSGDIPGSLYACVELNSLDLSYNNLTGNIPIGFGNLSQLQQLSLRNNQLTGELPSTIFNISSLLTIELGKNGLSGRIPEHICSQPAAKLQKLVLLGNQFEGEIPANLMRCYSLKWLNLALNKFTGNIPSGFWNLSAIQRVVLGFNELTGTIPPSVGNLSNLDYFGIRENNFHGTIPSKIGELSKLTYLNLASNKLNGEVPQSIFNLSSLQELSFPDNNLSGNLDLFSIDKRLPNIEVLILGDNQLHGKIPNSLSNLSRLNVFDLSYNSFTGHIPISLGNLRQLETLGLGNNLFTNNLSNPEQDFLSSLTNCKYLSIIWIQHNPITGVLPKSLGSSNLSASLHRFIAFSCKIIGPLPNELGNLSNLMWLDVAYNDLTGGIPATLGRLRNLQKLDINGNKLQGSISHVLCNLNKLYSVSLAQNNLTGQLPRCIGNLSMLREINLADNAFNSSIPSTLWLNGQFEKMSFSRNFLDGSLSRDIGKMKSLREFYLSENEISGEIPSTISQLQSLQHLDLSHNKLSGPIPKSLETLVDLSYFNVSFNELTGEIPNIGPFVSFTAEFFIGNKGLCGAPRFKVQQCKSTTPAPSRKNKLLKYILPGIALVFIAALILILIKRSHGRKLSASSLLDLPIGLIYERVSHLEILRATNNLDEEKLIGRGSFGSVYRGSFSHAMDAAVKVFNLDVQGALKSFDTECQILRSLRHKNLVKVITSCSNLDFKALVMSYMPNGNLEKWLYSNFSLNIFQRLGIIIDVACAIEYLHEGYTFPIVHCDLKPNNILLDEDMVAHVADFGIAKLLTEDERMQQTRTLGTIGYMAPEYGSEGLVSTMVDVYSFGILLMEIFSKRKPIDEMFSGELTMKRWVSESFPNSVIEIVDDELLNMDDENARSRHVSCLTSIIGLALECTTDSPEERPTMKDVLARIKKFKLNLSNHK